MNGGQRVTLELLIVFAVLVVFISGSGKGFWQTLFQRNPYQIEPPRIEWPSLAGGGSLFAPKAKAS